MAKDHGLQLDMNMFLANCAASGFLLFVLVTTAWGDHTGQNRPTREDPNSGPNLYRTYCASCHGAAGHGDGPAAKTLRVAVPDLTTIAGRRGGIYPSSEIAQIIDGRTPLAAHTREGMPLWGTVLRRMEGENEVAVKARVTALVTYLETLQRNRSR